MSVILALIGFVGLLPIIIWGILNEEEWVKKEQRFFRGVRRLVGMYNSHA